MAVSKFGDMSQVHHVFSCCVRRLQAMSDSLMYRLCYYRFAEAAERATGRRGYDRVRNADIGLMDFKCGSVP